MPSRTVHHADGLEQLTPGVGEVAEPGPIGGPREAGAGPERDGRKERETRAGL